MSDLDKEYSHSPYSTHVRNAVAIAIGILLALVVAEGILRLVAPQMTGPIQFAWDPDLGAIPVPAQSGRITLPGVYSYVYTNDLDGLRVVPRTATQRPSTGRAVLLLLGDSFTYGIGVDDTDTFAAQLQQQGQI